jgi:hypothetical protein
MTQTKRLTALASAFTLALLTGSAAVYANSKERIGVDNVDACEQVLRDPECTNDTAMTDERNVGYGYVAEQTDDVDDEATELRRRTTSVNDDGFADY